MTGDILSLPGLAAALVLPWMVGIACARLLVPVSCPGKLPVLIGYGYFLGALISTLAIRLADVLGAPIDFVGLCASVALFGLLCLLLGRMRAFSGQPTIICAETVPPGAKIIIGTLMILLAWRYLTMLGIMIEQPLFGWDAMMNWAPKAVVWFHNNELTEFVNPQTWLQEAEATGPYTLGNEPASTYPEMVPLIFLWQMLGAGTWDHPLLQLPWLLAGINLGLALYGMMRRAGVTVLYSAIGCYFFLSLPYLNIHTMVAGYADLWLAAAFSIGAISLNEWERGGKTGMAWITLIAALMCMQLKNPGIILGLMLMAGMARSKLAITGRTELLILVAGTIVTVLAFQVSWGAYVPGLGVVSLTLDGFQVGMYGPYQFKFHPEASMPVLRSLFAMGNWHLLWYLVLLIPLSAIAINRNWRRPGTLAVILAVVTAFYFVVFFLSSYYTHAVSFVTLNRAVLYVIPSLIFWLFTQWTPGRDRSV